MADTTTAATVARATAAQEQAAADRIAATGVDPSRSEVHDTAGHGEDGPLQVTQPQPQDEPQQRTQPEPRHDPRPNTRREEIARQIAAQRRGAEQPEDGDPESRLAQDELPPYLQAEPEPEPAPVVAKPEQTPPAETPAAKFTIKVRGKEMEVTQDELIAMAQKNAAGDSYFEDARTAAEEARRALAEIRAERARLETATHPGGPDGTQPAADDTATPSIPEPEHPSPELIAAMVPVIEKMQLGSPEEAAAEYAKVLKAETDRIRAEILPTARMVSVNDRTQADINNTVRARAEFERANADLVSNEDFTTLMEAQLYREQLSDLRAIGMDEAKIREQLKKEPSLGDISRYHQLARVNNLGVRGVEGLMADAKQAVITRLPHFAPQPSSQTTQPTEPRQPGAPRIEVRVDRAANRQALRPQPTRTGAPAAVTPAQQQRDITDVRSEAIAKQIAARNRVRGLTAGG